MRPRLLHACRQNECIARTRGFESDRTWGQDFLAGWLRQHQVRCASLNLAEWFESSIVIGCLAAPTP